jgi:outer membrane protein OmpA-like peptidoglycan-associated protein
MLAFCTSSFAQSQQIKKADKFYKLNDYSQAISLYEEGLQEEESLSAKTKLAYCYKMTNRLSSAEQLYSEIVNEERARPITKYYYGETLMSNGKYAEAKSWFLKYAEQNPNDERAIEMARACDKVGVIRPVFENIEVNSFSQNSRSDDSGPVFYKDGIVFTSDRKSGVNPLKQKSGWTGRDFLKMYYSKSDSTGTYQKPQDFSNKLNELNKHCGPLSFNEDQNFVVFTKTGTDAGKNETYNMQLYFSESSNGTKWKKPKVVSFCKKDHNYMHPALSADGKTLYFVSDKPGGEGGTDIYKSRMTEKGWGAPLNLGTEVNTSVNEGFPFIGQDDKLYFSSKGHPGFGGFDVFVAEQNDKGLWSKPRNVGAPINSSNDDISFHLNKEFTKGVFSSSRGGDDDNIYTFEISESTIINTELEELEEIYVREPLKPTTTSKVVVATKVNVNEETVTNQSKNETQSNEGTDEIGTTDNSADQNKVMTNSDETEIVIEEVKTEVVQTEEADDFEDTFVPNNETEIENTDVVETESEISDHQSIESNQIQDSSEPKDENEVVESNVEIRDERKINVTPSGQTESTTSILVPDLFKDRPMPTVFPMVQMKYLIKKGVDIKGKTFRLNGVQFEKGKYVITQEITLKLNLLIDILEENPDLEVEIASHTSSVGDDIENLEISRARAGAIAAHLINRGISSDRLNAEGYGENRLLNRCKNGVNCSEKQNNANERVEIAIF